MTNWMKFGLVNAISYNKLWNFLSNWGMLTMEIFNNTTRVVKDDLEKKLQSGNRV